MATPYGIHPSVELCELFSQMAIPYQGQEPGLAKVIFVGLDANYSAEVFAHDKFRSRILEYHENGVEFWEHYGTHHPFLLDEYPLKKNRGGVPYHRKFKTMGLSSQYAKHISFVELLDIPTVGSTVKKRFWELFNPEHAKRLDVIFNSGEKRLVLLPGSVIRNMQYAKLHYGVFSWMPATTEWGKFHQIGETEFHKVRHFSSSITTGELKFMGRLIQTHCSTSPRGRAG